MPQHTASCGTCPYRRSTPVGIWSPAEYDNLRENDERELGSAVFGCHLKDGSVCRGWAVDQKRRGLPSIPLRLELCRDTALSETFAAIDENDPDIYRSIDEMCAANEGRAFPRRSKKAQKLAALKDRKPCPK